MSLVVTVDLVVVAQYACTLLLAYYCVQFSGIFFEWPVARASVDPALAEAPSGGKTFDLKAHESAGAYGKLDTSVVKCWDPCTLADLGSVPATAPADVVAAVARCRAAQATWATSTFAQRRTLMKIMLRFVVENQATIARVAVCVEINHWFGGPHQTSELSISVTSKSIWLIFGRIDCSRCVLEARRESSRRNRRIRSH